MDEGDAKQFAKAHAEHAAACRVYAGRLAPPSAAEDATQEAFVKLCRRLAAGDGMPDHPRAWLLSAVRSAALDLRRSDRRRDRREAFVASADTFVPSDTGLDGDTVIAALDTLPERQREVVVLHLWAGLTFAEAGGLMGVSASTAHAAYTAGLAAMRKRLDPEETDS